MNYRLIIILLLSVKVGWSQQAENRMSLKQAIDYGISNSYAMRNASDDIRKARHKVWETTSIGLPQINGNIGLTNNLKLATITMPDEDDVLRDIPFGSKFSSSAGIGISQLLFDGTYLVGLRASKTYLNISKKASEKTEFAIKEAVTQAYLTVLLTKEIVTIYSDNITEIERNLSEMEEIVANGMGEQQDVDQLKLSLNSLKNELDKNNRLELISVKMLNFVLGDDITNKIVLTDTFETIINSDFDDTLAFKEFNVKNHIDYQISDVNVEAKDLLVKAEQSKYLHSLSASAIFSKYKNAKSFSDITGGSWGNSSSVSFKMNIPIFTSFGRKSIIKQEKLNLIKARRDRDQLERQLELNQETAKSDFVFAISNYNNLKEGLKLAERIEEREVLKFTEGLSSSFELTNIRNQLYSSQINYIQSLYSLIDNKTKLESTLNIK